MEIIKLKEFKTEDKRSAGKTLKQETPQDLLQRSEKDKADRLKEGALKMFSPSKTSESDISRYTPKYSEPTSEYSEKIEKKLASLRGKIKRLERLRDFGEIDPDEAESKIKEIQREIESIQRSIILDSKIKEMQREMEDFQRSREMI